MFNKATFAIAILFMGLESAVSHDLANLGPPPPPDSLLNSLLPKLATATLSAQNRTAVQSIVEHADVWTKPVPTVCFGPSKTATERSDLVRHIIAVASEWTTNNSGVVLDFGHPSFRLCSASASADIRIDVSDGGSHAKFFSQVGRASHANIPDDGYFSMELQFPTQAAPDWYEYYSSEKVFRFYVLHEFGHALGLQHEHQRKHCDYDFDYIAKHFNFKSAKDAEEQMKQIFFVSDDSYTNNSIDSSTPYDPLSIMKYNMSDKESPDHDDPKVYKDGSNSPCYKSFWISDISQLDFEGVRKVYGRSREINAAIMSSLGKSNSNEALSAPAIKALGLLPFSISAPEPESDYSIKLKNAVDAVRADPKAFSVLNSALESVAK
ncbi:M12 family metallopeptidase [Rhizobium sp. NXC24]|uniref:M12 family metallopeptidase n=1 Tax=Rhizobium sp. NXC24 TaxID=2048897 RepID=UPI000CDF335E|nr:M12 family metallopeptidase [Rhizobium sp. NXC24]AVA26065.1 metallopeptidase family protein [Rhizobium sp. NXC24]